MMSITKDRKKLFHLTEPYQESEFGLLVNANSAFKKDSDLKDRIITYHGMPFLGRLLREHFPGSVHLSKTSLPEAVRSVCVGEAQAVFDDRIAVFSLLLSDSPCLGISLRFLPVSTIKLEVGMGATRKSRAAADAIREEIGVMAGDGSLEKIMSGWSYDSGQELSSLLRLQHAKTQLQSYRIGLAVVAGLLGFALWAAGSYRKQRIKAQACCQALDNAERNMRMVTDSLSEMVIAYDSDKNVTYSNSGAEKLTGYGSAELKRATALSWTHPEDQSQLLALWDKVSAGQAVDQIVYRVLTKQGKVKWVAGSWGPVTDEVGRHIGIRGTCQDITDRVVAEQLLDETTQKFRTIVEEMAERKRAEAALRESEERLRFAQKAANIGTFDWNIETGVNTWTPELEAIYGLPQGGFRRTQLAWEELVHPDDRARAIQRMRDSFESGAPVEEEWRVIRPDGSVHWVAGRWQVFKNDAGKPLRVMGVNIDVTDRKQMEKALRRSEERFRLAIAATNDAIWDVDLKAGTVSWNETYSRLYGRPPETSNSWQWWMDRIHPEDCEAQSRRFAERLAAVHPVGPASIVFSDRMVIGRLSLTAPTLRAMRLVLLGV
jgi:PAS domain S-box-containing protein